ncbi:MAG: hypothetical protein QNI84_11970 [Henriciella sp.]|nr:hypothetical protein [Henriciella sp.]
MTVAKTKDALRVRKSQPVSSLLRYLAGEHADRIAWFWPAPHEGFFALPASRRHAAAILVNRLVGADQMLTLKSVIERGRDAQVARLIVGDGVTAGVMKALAKMGEQLWQVSDYETFLELFAEPNANRTLRHLETLRPANFAPISVLPTVLREAGVIAAVPNLPAAVDLASAFKITLRLQGEAHAGQIARQWARAKDTKRLFEMAAGGLIPHVFSAPRPAPVLPAPFERVQTRKQLIATALEFANCLRDFTTEIAIGRMAVYVWHGAPKAALALTWDAAGWRLAEAEAKANTELEEAPLRDIVAAVEAAGARTGPAIKTLTYRLERRGHGDASVDPPGASWVDQLELGDLWD